MAESQYTFGTAGNSYFNGSDAIVKRQDGETIRVQLKEGYWAIDVKDRVSLATNRLDVQTAIDEIGEAHADEIYSQAQTDFWEWANELARDSGLDGAGAAGRSGGWLCVEVTRNWEPDLEPDESDLEPDESIIPEREKFLAFGFDVVGAIDGFRDTAVSDILDAAEQARSDKANLDEFLRGYQVCALWSSSDDSEEPLDGKYGVEDIDAETTANMRAECAAFIDAHSGDLERAIHLLPSRHWDSMGHDFWLTRNGHGAGYWDRDIEANPEDREVVKPILERLSKASREAGERYLWPVSGEKVSEQ